jgi:hypothetical protein
MTKTTLVICAGLAFAGCKKKNDDAGATGGTTASKTAAAPTAPADTGPFAAWDIAGRKAAFQGTHVAPGGAIGMWEAWKVEGTKMTIWDGKAETVAELSVPSPCEAVVSVTENGGTSSTTHHFTIENGQIVSGLGDAGSRKGADAVACVSNKVVTLAGGKCTEWEQDMFDKTKYKSSPGTCSFAKDGDKEVFKATVNGSETTLEVHGDALYSTQIAQTHSEKAADWTAAKATRDGKK